MPARVGDGDAVNTLTQHHLALEDSLGESVDRINAQAEAAINHIEEMAAKADRRTAFNLARTHWRGLLGRLYGPDSPIVDALAGGRFTSLEEQRAIYESYLYGRRLMLVPRPSDGGLAPKPYPTLLKEMI